MKSKFNLVYPLTLKIVVFMPVLQPLGTKILISLLLVSFLNGCQCTSSFNEQEEINKILALHNLQKEYHLEKKAEAFASLMSSEHLSVNRGEVKNPTKEENTKRFSNYFNAVEFEKWDDLEPPIIRFSDDYTVAYTIVNKDVIVKYPNENNEMIKQQTEFSWVAIYKKYKDGWKIDCVASTNKPSITNIID